MHLPRGLDYFRHSSAHIQTSHDRESFELSETMQSTQSILLISSNTALLDELSLNLESAGVDALVVSIDAPSSVTSPLEKQRFRHLSVQRAALCSSKYLAGIIRKKSISVIVMDFSNHANELGLSTAFLAALKEAEFEGRLIYLSVFGNLLEDSSASRALREACPVKAAVEHQLRNRYPSGSTQTGFSWIVLGPAGPISSHSPPGHRSQEIFFSPVDAERRSKHDRFQHEGNVEGPSSSVNNQPESSQALSPSTNRVGTSDIGDAILRAVQDGGQKWAGEKVMIGTKETWTVSFMHQTDWEGKK